jgi:hypothetical protein
MAFCVSQSPRAMDADADADSVYIPKVYNPVMKCKML